MATEYDEITDQADATVTAGLKIKDGLLEVSSGIGRALAGDGLREPVGPAINALAAAISELAEVLERKL